LLKIDQLSDQEWKDENGEKDEKELGVYAGGTYHYPLCGDECKDSATTVRQPPLYFSQSLGFTVKNKWQGAQLQAQSFFDSQRKKGTQDHLDTTTDDFVYSLSDQMAGNPRWYLSSKIPGAKEWKDDNGHGRDQPALPVQFYIGLIIAVLLFLYILFIRWFSKNILGLYSRNQLATNDWSPTKSEKSCLWLFPNEQSWKLLKRIPAGNRFNLNQYVHPATAPVFHPTDDDKPVLVTNLESVLLNPAIATQVLYELEEQIYKQGRQVVITSAVDPMPYIIENEKHEYEKWARLFSHADLAQGDWKIPEEFKEKVRKLKNAEGKHLEDFVADVVIDELGWHPELHLQLQAYKDRLLLNLIEKQVFRLLINPQRALCTHLWNLSTNAERRVLYQLARGNLVNPAQWETILKLQARGLVVLDPGVRLISFGLQKAILESVSKAEIRKLDQPEEVSTWALIRAPLIVLLGLVGLFLFVTQRDLFDTTMGMAMGAVVALPAITRMLSAFGSDGAGAAKVANIA